MKKNITLQEVETELNSLRAILTINLDMEEMIHLFVRIGALEQAKFFILKQKNKNFIHCSIDDDGTLSLCGCSYPGEDVEQEGVEYFSKLKAEMKQTIIALLKERFNKRDEE